MTDYPKAQEEKVISRIIQKLKKVAPDEAALKKSLQQLITLSRIRKLADETEKQIEAMPITYDIETDPLYNKGIEKGIEKGIIALLTQTSMTMEQIAKAVDVSIDVVIRIKNSLKK